MNRSDPIPALKNQLARELVDRLAGFRQDYAAAFVGTDAARISNLRNARLGRFSLEQLIRFITRDHGEVTIHVAWKSRWEGRVRGQRRAPRTPRPGATP